MACAISLLTACVDDNEGNQRDNDGYLHFNLQFNGDQQSRWTEDGTGSHTRLGQSLTLTSPEVDGLTLYLHAEESDIIETTQPAAELPVTRGQRLTGEVFPAIGSFGLYGKIGDNVVTGTDFFKIDFASTDVPDADGYYEKEYEFAPDGTYWNDGETGNFYAYAPYNTTATAIATSISDKPTLTYTMPAGEPAQKDVLAAKHENVSRSVKNSDGIQMQFHHVLSAVKFKVNDKEDGEGHKNNVFKATVEGGGTYYLKVKKIKVAGVYTTGTMHFDAPTSEDGTIQKIGTDWGYWQRTDATGNCTVEIESPEWKHESDICFNTDAQCLMMLPQTTPADAKVILLCDMATDDTGTDIYATNVPFEAPLGNVTWLPGYSYTYKLSDSQLVHVLSISGAAFTSNFKLLGETKSFTVKSFYTTKKSGDNPDYSSETDGVPHPGIRNTKMRMVCGEMASPKGSLFLTKKVT